MSSPKTKKQLLAPAPLSRTADCERLLSPQSPPATEKLDLVGLQIRARDRFFFVYAVFLLFGVATLLPWNIFLNATDYFIDYKLNTAESYNAQYRKNFTFITGMIGQVTNIAINIMNVFVACGGDPKKRVPWAIVVSSSVVLLQILLAAVNSESWPGTFFVLCCVSVFIMYVATGILQSCVFFVASILPMEYTNSVILGSSLAGVFTSVMSILTKASSPDPKSAAIFYFFSAFVALASALGGYFLMHKTKFYRAFEALARTSTKCTTSSLSAPRPPYWAIFKKTWLVLFCIWLNLFSTLCIFPVYLLGVQPNNPDFLKFAGVSWFHDIVTFLTFNVAVAIGNVMPRFFSRVSSAITLSAAIFDQRG
jgi:solute carrier family 29 (equilibrative nucleoside transporter), member 1/2/3